MIRRPPRSTQSRSSAASDVYKRQHQEVAHLLTEQLTSDLDRLLMFDVGLGMTRLAWLTKSAVEATASSVKAEIDKLMFLLSLIHISEPTRLGMISYAVFCL